ncbi:stage V sporulation protein B [Caldalkalibacillus uzonensis]|uniref:Stage V sporulation protein B n=1 Tax=Caldalkalibacillus uzonensis TaxID=353224 RepID=A0ABU0CSW7_9BACI|nr:stage V sporulation protein B [Caldalkalibacillus uzonensis]MDQ0339523.1 stage V sporulation protein B [Caldalkalibacillus uzonensis]
MSKQSFIQGAVILILAGFITKILGFVNRIVMARILGPEGVGLYMMAVPILILVITLTRLGLPVAISKLVAEAEAQGDRIRVKRILVVSLSITAVLSIICTVLTLLGAKVISAWFLTDERAYWPLMAITPIIPIVAISSVIKGYFQGKQNMRPSAYAQVIEQVVRISLVVFLATLLLPLGLEFAAAGAMISVVIGEAAALFYLLTTFKYGKRKKTFRIRQGFFTQLQKGKETLHDLLRIGLPATGSGLIGSVSWTLEPILVAQSLAAAGVATAVATAQYGLLSGYAIPLVMLPMFITYSLSVSLVPAISEAQATHHHALIHRRLYQALRIALICGAPSTVVMIFFAEPLTTVVYGTPEAGTFLKLLAPFFLLLYFQSPLQATLQGLDMAKTAMMNTLYGAMIKMMAIVILASRPSLGIYGAALAININVCLVTLLHFFSVVKVIKGFSIHFQDVLKVGIAMAVMAVGGLYCLESLQSELNLSLSWALVLTLFFAGGIYFLSLLVMKVIGRQDIERIPLIGPHIAPFFPKR